jgi:hypothetical protein
VAEGRAGSTDVHLNRSSGLTAAAGTQRAQLDWVKRFALPERQCRMGAAEPFPILRDE